MKKSDSSKKKNNRNKLTKHHIIPRSREGGNGENVMKIPDNFHQLWHGAFGNMLPEETIEFIKIVFLGKGRKRSKKKWTTKELYELQVLLQLATIEEEKTKTKKR